jgi:NitT/TauT family transport system permease protein
MTSGQPRSGAELAKTLVRRLLPPILLGAAMLSLYVWGHYQLEGARRFLLPLPATLWTEAFGLEVVRAELWSRLLITCQIAFAGLAISIGLGMVLAIFMHRSKLLERASYPYLVALQAIPVLAITPLLQAGLGYGLTPKVMVCVIISFFPIPTVLLYGLKSTNKQWIELFQLYGAGWWTILFKVKLPSAMPTLFAAFRISAGLSVIGAIVGELFFRTGQGGLGQMLINSKFNFQYPRLYAALIVSSLLSISIFLLFSWAAERLFAPWHESESR